MKTALFDAYLIVKVSLKHPSTKKDILFEEDTPIKIDIKSGQAYIGPYMVLLYFGDYSLVV